MPRPTKLTAQVQERIMAALRAAGFTLHHVRRHRIYRHTTSGRSLIVAAHRGHEIRPGTVQAIRRDIQDITRQTQQAQARQEGAA